MQRPKPCTRCGKRVPYQATRCVGCGSYTPGQSGLARFGLGRASVGIIAAILLVGGFFAVRFSDRYVPAVADWYTQMVIQYLPSPAMRFAPVADEQRAFYVCARQVVKRMESEGSIATFARGGTTSAVGEDRYVVQSSFDEALVQGDTRRHTFRCTVRITGSGWVLEELELQPAAEAPPTLIAAQ